MTQAADLGAVSFAELQDRRLAAHADRPFLTFYDDDRDERVELTYKNFDNWVHKLAGLLADEFGVVGGDRVATVTGPHWQATAVHFACWRIGACAVPVDVAEPPAGKAGILAATGCVVAFVREEWLAEVAAATAGAGDPPVLVGLPADVFGTPDPAFAAAFGRVPNFAGIVPSMPDVHDGDEPGGLDDAALVVLTAGEAAPQGVTLTQADLLTRAAALAERWQVTDADRTMAFLPDHDLDGTVTGAVVAFGVGGGTVVQRRFDPATLLRRVAAEHVSVLDLTAGQAERLLDAADAGSGGPDGLDLGRLHTVAFEGGPPPEPLARRWRDRFGFPLRSWAPGVTAAGVPEPGATEDAAADRFEGAAADRFDEGSAP